MDVAAVLRRASDVVDRAGVAADLRSVAFTTAVELLLKGAPDAVLHPGGDPLEDPSASRVARLADRYPGPTADHPSSGDDPFDGVTGGGRGPFGAGDLDDDDAPAASVSRLGRAGTSAHRSATGPRVAARVDQRSPGFGPASAPTRLGRTGDRLVAVGPRSPSVVADDPWGHIADALGVRPELLDRVWEERGGRLQLAGDPSRLGRTRAQRVGTAAVLLLAALRWSGRDGGEPVPDSVVRVEIERLGLLDTGNYTKHLAGRRQLLSTSGSGRTATYKLRYDGLEEARTIAQALLEDG